MSNASISYGQAPVNLGMQHLCIPEYMRYQYLPVKMRGEGSNTLVVRSDEFHLPPNLSCLSNILYCTKYDFLTQEISWLTWSEIYVYVTVVRGFATPDNPLNRPGWHCDGFGSINDINYVWNDRFPTRYAIQEFQNIDSNHVVSMQQFDEQIKKENIVTYPDRTVLRLNPYVVHATPIIDPPGGERQFVKISLSPHRYNLEGNSHNYLIDYDWKMYPRSEIRNDPVYGERDYYPQTR